ncbi:MAG: hypothetical protein PVF05_09635 [Gemmatimonadales bacterium]
MNGHGVHAPDMRGETISEETAGRLRYLAGRIPPEELSEVWVFPPLDDIDGSDEFHLFTRRMSEGVYRVCAAEFAGDAQARVSVYGAVPESRVQRVVDGFRDRLGESREPLYLPIFGSVERWRLAVGADPQPELVAAEASDVEAASETASEAASNAEAASDAASSASSNGTAAVGGTGPSLTPRVEAFAI